MESCPVTPDHLWDFTWSPDLEFSLKFVVSANVEFTLDKIIKAEWAKRVKYSKEIFKKEWTFYDTQEQKETIQCLETEPVEISIIQGSWFELHGIHFFANLSNGQKAEVTPDLIDWNTDNSDLAWISSDRILTALEKPGRGVLDWEATILRDGKKNVFNGKVIFNVTESNVPSHILFASEGEILTVNRGELVNLQEKLNPVLVFSNGSREPFSPNCYFAEANQPIPNGILEIPRPLNSWPNNQTRILVKHPSYPDIAKDITIKINADASILLPPENLQATADGSSIVLTWNPRLGVEKIRIFCSRNPGMTVSNYESSFVEEAGAGRFVHSENLLPGMTYYYCATFFNSTSVTDDESEATAIVSATTENADSVTVPEKPGVITVVSGIGKNTLSWGPVVGAAWYNLSFSTDMSVLEASGTVIENVVSPFSHEDLMPGQPYYYILTAGNYAGVSSASEVAEGVPLSSDTVSPFLISTNPASGSLVIDISASNTVALYFSEPIKKGSSGNIWIKSRTENTLISSIPVTDGQIQVEENILKISPTFMFQSSQTIKGQADDYKIEIDAGAIKDLAGNSFGGLDESSALYFGVKKVWFTLANWSFEALAEHASVVFNGKIWVIGGVNNTPTSVSTVYSSSDGVTWALVSNNKFLPRWQHRAVVFNNQMWILGGMGDLSTSFRTEAWSSSDGINWSLRSTASCLNRSRHEALVYNNKIWIMGGKRVNTYFNDVWSSPDGINWSQVTASASWAPAGAFGSLVFDNKMWLIIGNKVWNSVDGANWSLVSILPSFWYLAASAYVYDGKMWVVGGGTDGNLNSAYFSKDGISWTAVSDPSQDLPGKHTGVLFNNRMFILGGFREPNSMTKEVRWAW